MDWKSACLFACWQFCSVLNAGHCKMIGISLWPRNIACNISIQYIKQRGIPSVSYTDGWGIVPWVILGVCDFLWSALGHAKWRRWTKPWMYKWGQLICRLVGTNKRYSNYSTTCNYTLNKRDGADHILRNVQKTQWPKLCTGKVSQSGCLAWNELDPKPLWSL